MFWFQHRWTARYYQGQGCYPKRRRPRWLHSVAGSHLEGPYSVSDKPSIRRKVAKNLNTRPNHANGVGLWSTSNWHSHGDSVCKTPRDVLRSAQQIADAITGNRHAALRGHGYLYRRRANQISQLAVWIKRAARHYCTLLGNAARPNDEFSGRAISNSTARLLPPVTPVASVLHRMVSVLTADT